MFETNVPVLKDVSLIKIIRIKIENKSLVRPPDKPYRVVEIIA